MRAYPRYLLFGFAALLLCLSCGGVTDTDTNDIDDNQPLASETIGSEGGTLSGGQLTVIVPAGAFSSSTNLKLYEETAADAFGADQISKTYLIEGMPSSYNTPVEVRLQYEGEMPGVGKVAVGEENILAISDEGSVVYSLFAAEDSSGYLKASIPALRGAGSSRAGLAKPAVGDTDKSSRKIMAVKNQVTATTTSDGNFIVHYPAFLATSIRTLVAEDLMDARQKIEAMNFRTDEIEWPINVYISPLNDRDENRCVAFMPAYDKMNLYVDSERLKNPGTSYDHIDCGMGRELFHAIISKYDFYYFTGALLELNLEHYWFHTAVALWCEEKFRAARISVPVAFWGEDYLFKGDRGAAPFQGLQKGVGSTRYEAYKHGCGMAGMIKYLVGQYGESLILNIYNDISNTDCHPVTALLRNISDPVSTWWPAFMRSYLAGDIYQYDPLGDGGDYGEGLRSRSGHVFTIDDASDTEADCQPFPPDISATDFAVMLNWGNIDSSASLRATLTDYSGSGENMLLMMYGFGSRVSPFGYFLEPWDEATTEITVSNLRALKDNDYHGIVFVLTNANYRTPDYKDNRIVDMNFEVLTPNFHYDHCDFMLYCNMTIKSVDTHDTTTFTTDMAVGQSYIRGGFQGNKFIGELDPDYHYEEGTVEIEIDPKTYHVIRFSYNSSWEDQGLISTWSIESNGDVDLPATFISPFYDSQENEATGQWLCDNCTVERFWQFAGTTQTVEGISCNSSSYIMISFDTESDKQKTRSDNPIMR